MTLVDPVNPLSPAYPTVNSQWFPGRVRPYNNIQPFTYRDGETYLDVQTALRTYVSEYLITFINDSMKDVIDDVNVELSKLGEYASQFEGYVDIQKGIIDSAVTAFNTALAAGTAHLDAAVVAGDAAKAASEAARDKAQQYAATAGDMADETIAEFVDANDSRTIAAFVAKFTTPYTPEMFGAKRDGITDDTKAIQDALNAANAAGGGIVQMDTGTYAIDAHKGSAVAYDPNKRGGLWYDGTLNNVHLAGKGKGVTILKNIADDATMGIGVRGGTGLSWSAFTIDLDYPNKTTAALAFSSTRGEGAIYWNGTAPASSHLWQDVDVRNTGHYGIGIQNVACTDIKIVRASFYRIGGDAIDIKEWLANPNTGAPAYPKNAIFIDSPYADTIGLNATEDAEQQDAAGFDIRGEVTIINPIVVNLNTYEVIGGPVMIGATGVRVQGRVDSEFRLGGRNVRIIGGYVKSNKALSEGAEDVKRIIGLRISSSDTMVTGFIADNCYVGVRITPSGNSTPQGSMVDAKALNCNTGLNITSGCNNGVINFTANNCGIAASIPGNAIGNVLNLVSRAATTKDWDIPSVVYYRNMTKTYPPITPEGYADDAAAGVASIPAGQMYVQSGPNSGIMRMKLS